MPDNIAQKWNNDLTGKSYRYEIRSYLQYLKFRFRPYTTKLKRIIKLGQIKSGMKILDFGVGGGHDSIPLAFMGYEVYALDCSEVVLKNLIEYKSSVEKYAKKILRLDVTKTDILEADVPEDFYDIIFSCGVMEHFIDSAERKQIYQILAKSLRAGGRVITFVPNGVHPVRAHQRKNKLGGYNIEEIDYTLEQFERDISETGLILEKVKGFDLFGYIFISPRIANCRFLRIVIKPFYLFLRLFEELIPFVIMQRYAYWLFFVARKI